MDEQVTLTIKISTKNKYDCPSDSEQSIVMAPFESLDAFLSRARTMYLTLKG